MDTNDYEWLLCFTFIIEGLVESVSGLPLEIIERII